MENVKALDCNVTYLRKQSCPVLDRNTFCRQGRAGQGRQGRAARVPLAICMCPGPSSIMSGPAASTLLCGPRIAKPAYRAADAEQVLAPLGSTHLLPQLFYAAALCMKCVAIPAIVLRVMQQVAGRVPAASGMPDGPSWQLHLHCLLRSPGIPTAALRDQWRMLYI